jgi:hypothetical protein
MMATIVRKRWTLVLVFGVGLSDEDAIEKSKFGHEEVHFHGLDATIRLATQSVKGTGDISVWRHDIVG